MPELSDDHSSFTVACLSDGLSFVNLLLTPNAWHIGPSQFLSANAGGLAYDKSCSCPLRIVLNHHGSWDPVSCCSTSSERRPEDAVLSLYGTSLQWLEDLRHGQILDCLNRTNFDAVNEVNESIGIRKPLQDQHVLSVELMVKINGYMQDIAEKLRSSIKQLKMAGERVPHEIILKNDVRIFSDQLAELLPTTTSLVGETRRCEVFSDLPTSNEV